MATTVADLTDLSDRRLHITGFGQDNPLLTVELLMPQGLKPGRFNRQAVLTIDQARDLADALDNWIADHESTTP